jgi:hypothetical protein
MPCVEMKELETNYSRYVERRNVTIPSASERRKVFTGRRQADEARAAYIMEAHRQNCTACRPRLMHRVWS